jgi:tRNA pseudouridine38-40 synthase
MMGRLKLIIAYDGAPFAGWQSQRHRNTIQDHLERAFAVITSGAIRVHGAGRTDAGVHALAQCAHVDVNRLRLAPDRLRAALNSQLPLQIRVMRCSQVRPAFHARYSAREKTYRYVVWNAPVLPPHEYQRAWHVAEPLNYAAMADAAGEFEGRHDFVGFTANRGKPPETTIRTIDKVRVRRTGARIAFEFAGNGFLYKMVRMMVGLLVQIGRGVIPRPRLRRMLLSPVIVRPRLVAPADGLVLVRVRY